MSNVKPTLYGKILKGKWIWKNEERATKFISTQLDGEYRMIIEKDTKDRSSEQNRFYWLYLRIIAEETGDDSVSLHEYFKRVYLPPKIIKARGKEIKIPASTTELDKIDFGSYLAKIERDTGVPSPDTDNHIYT